MGFSYARKEKLKSKKVIDLLFHKGSSVTVYPLKLLFLPIEHPDGEPLKTGVVVGKKHFKKAVDRNRIKRLMRESYRLHKEELLGNISQPFALMILYIGQDGIDFDTLHPKMGKLLSSFFHRNTPHKFKAE